MTTRLRLAIKGQQWHLAGLLNTYHIHLGPKHFISSVSRSSMCLRNYTTNLVLNQNKPTAQKVSQYEWPNYVVNSKCLTTNL